MLHAIIFDFDGVIADTEPLHLGAYQAVLGGAGIELKKEDYYARYLGYDDVGLFRALAQDRGMPIGDDTVDDWVAAKSRVIEEMLSDGSILFPGAASCVRAFAERVPLAIASGALGPEIEQVLDHAGLRGYFRAIASASDGVRGKPAPDLYLLAVAKLNDQTPVDASACLAIEDSRWGLEAARKAGLTCVAVTHTYPATELAHAADLVVDRLGDLTIAELERVMRDNGRAR
jgi:beta-phosphoglucomutase-like phosphatase (HAD superfamily)